MRSSYILFSYLSLFVFGFIDNARGPVYPKVLEVFSLSSSEGSWMFTLTSLVSFSVSLAIPLWLSRFGAVRAGKAAMLFHAGALFFMGFAGLSGRAFWLFLLGCALLGAAIGIQSATVNLVVSKTASPANASRLFSGLHSMYGLASLLSPLLLGAVFSLGFSWQKTLIVLALAPLLHFFWQLKLPALDLSRSSGLGGGGGGKSSFKLGIIFSFYMATEILVSSRLAAYIYGTGAAGLDVASYSLTAFFIFLLGGRLFFSFYTPRASSRSLLLVSAGATLVFYLLGLLWHPFILPLTGASISYFFPFGMNHIKANYPDAEAVIARVMIYCGAMLASMHFVFGMAADAFGMAKAMWIGPVLVVVVLVFLQLERREARHAPKHAPKQAPKK